MATRYEGPMRILPVIFLLALSACADVKAIENGKVYGPLTSMIDFFTSCQLLETSEGPVLFDACWRKDELAVRLKERGHAPADIIAVFLTHGHADHVGGLEALTNARLIALAAEQETISKHAKGDSTIDQVVTDGEVVSFGETKVRVFAVEGHTPGSAVYLVDGTLVLGDSGLATGKGDFAQVPKERSADPEQAIASMVSLSSRLDAEGLEVKWLLPAHSGGVAGKTALDAWAAKR
jgi:glyoxylase-like metal-dependent hydrolase (beta-lactamase superfamily II)